MATLHSSSETPDRRTARERWQEIVPHVSSNAVAAATVFVTWMVLTEVVFQILAFNRRLPEDLSVWVLMDTLALVVTRNEVGPEHAIVVSTLLSSGVAAVPMVFWAFRLLYAWVRTEGKVGPDDRRHVAYAWSSGVIGLLCVLTEALSVVDFTTEDLLLGVGALNMLVEEIQILDRNLKKAAPDHASTVQTKPPEPAPAEVPSTIARLRQLAEVGLFIVFFLRGSSVVSGLPTSPPPSELPSPSRVELQAESADGSVELTWSFGDVQLDAANWQYQRRQLGGRYGAWNDIRLTANSPREAGRHHIGGLTNGRLYIFRIRVANTDRADEWSNEVAVVPSVQHPAPARPVNAGSCDGTLLGEIHFRVRRDEVDTGFRDNQNSLTKILRELGNEANRDKRVFVAGYASADGKASANLDLSEKRAAAVVRHLSSAGIGGRLIPLAFGERPDEPVPGKDSELHRKVSVTLCRDEPENASTASTV